MGLTRSDLQISTGSVAFSIAAAICGSPADAADVSHRFGAGGVFGVPEMLRANEPAVEGIIVAAARYLGLAKPTFQGFLEWILELRAEIGIPHALSGLGIDAKEKGRVGQMAWRSCWPAHPASALPMPRNCVARRRRYCSR